MTKKLFLKNEKYFLVASNKNNQSFCTKLFHGCAKLFKREIFKKIKTGFIRLKIFI